MSFSEWVLKVDSFIWGWPLIIMLLGSGLIITIRLKLVQFWGLPHGLALITGKYDDPGDPGEITHFQALSAALSATLGTGNIAGVATAIHMGGPGALFWMWITAIVNAPLKYAGILLSHKYRTLHPDGEASGGPMYYLEKGLNAKPLAIAFAFFAAVASFGIGNMVQANTVANKLHSDLHIPPIFTGTVLAILLGCVILGGIKRIAHVASCMVPFMCLLYVGGAIWVLMVNVTHIPEAFKLIFHSAFNPVALTGGFVGTTVRYALEYGVKRGLFSNESGLGSASIAHAAARTKEPAREGLVGQVGPFIDTLLICTLTGLVILVTGAWHTKILTTTGINNVTIYNNTMDNLQLESLAELEPYTGKLNFQEGKFREDLTLFKDRGSIVTSRFLIKKQLPFLKRLVGASSKTKPFSGQLSITNGSIDINSIPENHVIIVEGKMLTTVAVLTGLGFTLGIGPGAGYIVTFAVMFFAFSTAISWSYYGDRSVEYLFGRKAIFPYRIIYVIFYFMGAILSLELVWNLADIANGLMAFPNLIGLVLMSGVVVELTRQYWQKYKY